MRLVLLMLLSSISISCYAKVEDRHLACTSDSDCVVIGTGGCCGQDLAVHKDFSEHLKKPAQKRCADEFHVCKNLEAQCVKNICTLVQTKDL